MRYAVVIEKAATNYAAHVPDLPGCVATGATIQETESMIREAIEFHLEGLQADSLPIPRRAAKSNILRSRRNKPFSLHTTR